MNLKPGDTAVQRFEILQDTICKNTPTEVFYPEKKGSLTETREAIARCVAQCSVRAECLQYATDNHEQGWWGGISERGRRVFRRSNMTAEEWLLSKDGQRYSHPQWGRPRIDE